MVGTSFILVPIIGLVAYAGGQDLLVTCGASFAASVAAAISYRVGHGSLATRLMIALAFAVDVTALIFAASRLSPASTEEAHMIFFVLDCFLVTLACWHSLAVYSGVIVLHHLVLTFFAPAAVWSAADVGARYNNLLVHAAIVVGLVSVLIIVAARLRKLIESNAASLREAREAIEQSEQHAQEAARNNTLFMQERDAAAALQFETNTELQRVAGGLGAVLSRLAGRDLTARVTEPLPTKYRQIESDLNGALDGLDDALASVAVHGADIAEVTGVIAEAASELSHRTELQAASLEEVAAAMQQSAASINGTAESVQQARKTVAEVREDAARTTAVLGRMVTAMEAIEASAQNISHAIVEIDSIAFQTNLLALNAGVEAARAGSAGAGFAVIASEVRALSLRAASAAKEIKQKIGETGENVASGVSLVAETNAALQTVAKQVSEIDTTIADIARAASEQATGSDQINASLAEIDRVAQQNAAMAERTTSAASQLRQRTESLESVLATFVLTARPQPSRDQPAEALTQRKPAKRIAA